MSNCNHPKGFISVIGNYRICNICGEKFFNAPKAAEAPKHEAIPQAEIKPVEAPKVEVEQEPVVEKNEAPKQQKPRKKRK